MRAQKRSKGCNYKLLLCIHGTSDWQASALAFAVLLADWPCDHGKMLDAILQSLDGHTCSPSVMDEAAKCLLCSPRPGLCHPIPFRAASALWAPARLNLWRCDISAEWLRDNNFLVVQTHYWHKGV